jgi:hypothetical protein
MTALCPNDIITLTDDAKTPEPTVLQNQVTPLSTSDTSVFQSAQSAQSFVKSAINLRAAFVGRT